MAKVHGRWVRFYPPFRSAEANELPMPHIVPTQVPLPERPTRIFADDPKLFRMAGVPLLGSDDNGQTRIVVALGPAWTERPAPFPMDSIRVDIEGTFDSTPEYPQFLIDQFLGVLRHCTRQWWLGHSIHGLVGYVRGGFGVDSSGNPLTEPDGFAGTRTVYGFEQPLTGKMWQDAIARMSDDYEPPEEDVLLLDAYYHLATGDLRRCVIDAATASEQAKDRAFESIWRRRSKEVYKRGRLITGYEIPQHVSADMQRAVGRSFEIDHPDSFEWLEHLWDARGSIAHGGRLHFRSSGAEIRVNGANARSMVRAAEVCLAWLAQL